MSVIIDAAPLVASGDANDPHLETIAELPRTIDGPRVVPAPVAAESTASSDDTWHTR